MHGKSDFPVFVANPWCRRRRRRRCRRCCAAADAAAVDAAAAGVSFSSSLSASCRRRGGTMPRPGARHERTKLVSSFTESMSMEILMSPFGARLRWPTAAVLQIRNLAARGANAAPTPPPILIHALHALLGWRITQRHWCVALLRACFKPSGRPLPRWAMRRGLCLRRSIARLVAPTRLLNRCCMLDAGRWLLHAGAPVDAGTSR